MSPEYYHCVASYLPGWEQIPCSGNQTWALCDISYNVCNSSYLIEYADPWSVVCTDRLLNTMSTMHNAMLVTEQCQCTPDLPVTQRH